MAGELIGMREKSLINPDRGVARIFQGVASCEEGQLELESTKSCIIKARPGPFGKWKKSKESVRKYKKVLSCTLGAAGENFCTFLYFVVLFCTFLYFLNLP